MDPETNVSVVRQSFSGEEMQLGVETASTAIAAAAKASIEARYILAMKRPRDWDTVRTRLLKECQRPGFADSAIYRKPVGKKKNEQTGRWEDSYIEGLSVRFAEAAIRHVSNFYSSATSVYDDAHKSVIRITVMDLETNATIEQDITVSKTVERRALKTGQRPLGQRMNSYGDVVYIVPATDDEVLNKSNAQISKALRNGVLRLLPGDIQDECEAKCRATQANRDKEDPEGEKKRLFDAFAGIGVEPGQLKDYLGHTNQLQPTELQGLRAIFAAIKASETTWSAVMETRNPAAAEESAAVKSEAARKTEEILQKHSKKRTPVEVVAEPTEIDRGDNPDNY